MVLTISLMADMCMAWLATFISCVYPTYTSGSSASSDTSRPACRTVTFIMVLDINIDPPILLGTFVIRAFGFYFRLW